MKMTGLNQPEMYISLIRSIAAAVLVASLLVMPTTAAPLQGTGDWKLIAPAGEGFSVRLPGKPDEETHRLPLMGNTYLMRLYTSVDEPSGIMFMVAMQEFSSMSAALQPAKRVEEFMRGFKEGLSNALGGAGVKLELIPERDLEFKNHFGRQYTISVGESRGVVRAFDATRRIYVLVAMGGTERNSNVGRFFNSFDITPAPPPVPIPIAPN